MITKIEEEFAAFVDTKAQYDPNWKICNKKLFLLHSTLQCNHIWKLEPQTQFCQTDGSPFLCI
jgi:DNA-binding XRE family transcriptional regulator